jgi:beta-glucanase (GH16 family)
MFVWRMPTDRSRRARAAEVTIAAILLVLPMQTLAATNYQVAAPMPAPSTRPSWADEFTTKAIDQTKWRFDTANNKTGWFNHERQYYAADRPENARIEDGALVIEARRESLPDKPDWGGQTYTSAKLVSRVSHAYGFYEIRAMLPCARGTWPALWLLPRTGKWPDAGEIDVMEMVGWQPNIVHATLHTAAFNHAKGTQRGGQIDVSTACTAYHRYQLDWRRDSITIGVDDKAYMRVANDRPGGTDAWPFTRPYDLILNLAIGGDWGGVKGIDDAVLPQRMRIDYVRYWKPDRRIR